FCRSFIQRTLAPGDFVFGRRSSISSKSCWTVGIYVFTAFLNHGLRLNRPERLPRPRSSGGDADPPDVSTRRGRGVVDDIAHSADEGTRHRRRRSVVDAVATHFRATGGVPLVLPAED